MVRKEDKKQSSSKLKTSKKSLLTQESESLDDDCEIDLDDDDEDEQQFKAPLIKNSKPKLKFIENNDDDDDEDDYKSKNRKSNLKKKKSVKFDCNGLKSMNDVIIEDDFGGDDEEEEELTSSRSSKYNSSLNTPPPITIGKIKIFKPSRRHRALRIRRFLKHCLSIVFCVAFLLFIWFNLKSLPKMIRSAFGIPTFSLIISSKDKSIQCDQVISKAIWRQNFPMLTIESALRLIDVNNDSQLDIIVPFGTGIDAAYYDETLCQIYFNQTMEKSKSSGCGGGVMALNGTNGEPLWAQYTPHELFATNCNIDLNNDGIKDCIIGGRMASLYAFDGRTGKIFWSITSNYGEPVMETSNFYTPLIIPKDLDSDSVPDLIVMHGGDPLRKPNQRVRNVARLMVISSRTGKILKWNYVSGNAESYYSPQLLVHPDGTLLIMYGTGGETHPGGLYVVRLESLLNGQLEHNSRTIFEDCCKGVMVPPVLIDINGDDILDIIMAHFNSTILAFDGLTFDQLWKRQLPGSETYSTPSVGFFNEDDIPDFGVLYQFGPGFPIYYHAEFHVLDGRNGNPLLKEPIKMPIGTQSSPLTISTLAQNDIFLFWYSGCFNSSIVSQTNVTTELRNSEISNGPDSSYQVRSDLSVHEKSRADFCQLRFGSKAKQFTKYLAITPPTINDSMAVIYDSRTDEPIVEKLNFTAISYQWYQDNFVTQQQQQQQINLPMPMTANDDGGVWGQTPGQISVSGNAYIPNQEPNSNSFGNLNNLNDFDVLKKFKKWSSQTSQDQDSNNNDPIIDQLLFDPQQLRNNEPKDNKRKRRHVGLHNGDQIQRVISTGTLAPSLKSYSVGDQLPVDGSIDLIFATYSFPPSSKVHRMSDAMKSCVQAYMQPEKETELRLLDESSPFKQMNYDHDAYEAAVNEICQKKTMNIDYIQDQQQQSMDDPIKANDWIREMGSMTVHRVNLKCFNQKKQKQIPIKEFKYQIWPSYLGINADSVANIIDS